MNRAMPLRLLAVVLLVASACGDSDKESSPAGISRTEGTPIENAPGWTWIPFSDAFCTDGAVVSGSYRFSTSTTGLAINWGDPGTDDVVFFLQGGGACWDFITCGGAYSLSALLGPKASTGPFGPEQFASDIYAAYPSSWVRRERLPPSLANATIVFIPYCTGDVHAGDKVTTYEPPTLLQTLPSITWHHVGHANIAAFLRRLGPTFPNPGKVVVAGSSAGGFGSLANYPSFRAYWPAAKSYLVDDSGPPLAGDAIPADTRAAWYASWNIGASLDAFCPECSSDMSAGMRHLAQTYGNDRIALLSHLQDAVIRSFFGTYSIAPLQLTPMDGAEFETALRALGADMGNTSPNAKYFFTLGEDGTGTHHPTLEDPTGIATPDPGLERWLELMISDSTSWTSASD